MKKVPSGFVPIRTSSLNCKWSLGMTIYVPVGEEAVRYAPSGEKLDEERLDRLKKFKFLKVLIRSEEEEKYRKYIEEVMNEAVQNTSLDVTTRTQVLSSGAENASQEVFENPADKTIYEKAQRVYERFGDFLAKNQNAASEMLKISAGSATDYVSHGIQVGTLALHLAEAAGLIRMPEWRVSLFTAAALHDLGMEKFGIPFKPHRDFTEEEKQKWLEHPTVAAELFKDKDFVDRLTLDLILEHEELPNGEGFPQKLSALKMNPLSIVLSLANKFSHYTADCGGDLRKALQDFSMNEIGRFDLTWIETLKKAVGKALGR